MKPIDLFRHELCINFQHRYEMDKEEADRFHEAFAHFHKIMTEINNQWLLNTVYLDENFFELWNENDPKNMLEICIEHAIHTVINKPKQEPKGIQ